MAVRRCTLRTRRQLGSVLALGGVLLIFVCLPVEVFVLVLGTGMIAVGIVLMDMG